MSGAKLLEFGTMPELGNLDFPDLESRLKHRLANTKSLPDLEKLIKLINPLINSERHSKEEQAVLKRLRQRAYDRRRTPKFKTVVQAQIAGAKSKIPMGKSCDQIFQKLEPPPNATTEELLSSNLLLEKGARMHTGATEKLSESEPKAEGLVRRFPSSIKGAYVITAISKLLGWLIASALVSFFLWQQSLALYETAGFTNSIYAAAGGILMIVGFAAYHSITRSWLALLLCIYAGAYESYLMISGTINHEKQTHANLVQSSPEMVFLQEQAERERAQYHELKQRYDNPESKVYKNEWFLKNHLNPSWDASSKAHEVLVAKKAELLASSSAAHVTWLKIFYRLGLVFLCMVLVHHFFTGCMRSGLTAKISA